MNIFVIINNNDDNNNNIKYISLFKNEKMLYCNFTAVHGCHMATFKCSQLQQNYWKWICKQPLTDQRNIKRQMFKN